MNYVPLIHEVLNNNLVTILLDDGQSIKVIHQGHLHKISQKISRMINKEKKK